MKQTQTYIRGEYQETVPEKHMTTENQLRLNWVAQIAANDP